MIRKNSRFLHSTRRKSIKIGPDGVLYCPNGDKILVEVANPEDPRRFVGEIVYPAILRKHKLIRASLVFVIGDIKKHGRSLTLRHILSQMLGNILLDLFHIQIMRMRYMDGSKAS